MNIVYLIDYDINSNSGVMQKILQQSSKWTELGHIVYFVSTKTLSLYDDNKNLLFRKEPLNINMGRFGTAVKLLYGSCFIEEIFEKIDNIDIVYMRYRLYMPFFNRILKRHKVVMEINSDDLQEYRLHSKVTHFYNKYTRNILLKYIDGFIAVSDELKEKFNYLSQPIEVIANGINSSQYDVVYENKNAKPTLVFIGTPNQPWHGIDKIIQMADYFKNFQFYIIGTDGEDTENIKYFGYLSKKESTEIIQKCDIGISTLSLFKTGLFEASPLKSRQYLACGLAIVYAYNDTDLTGDEEFVLLLENSENNIDYDKIKSFVWNVYDNRDIKQQAREFAVNVLDYSIKEQQRIQFFSKV